MRRGVWSGLVVLSLAGGPAYGQARGLVEASPEEMGFSSQRLGRLDAAMRSLVEKNEISGMVMALARHGRLVDFQVVGQQDVGSGTPMREDTIFKLYSMSKPVTGAAMMILYEEGKWNPDDPLAKHIPEFASLQVYAGAKEDGSPVLEPPAHPPTVGEVMTHTAGFSYGFFGSTPVDKMYQKDQPLRSASLQEFIEKLARLPLLYQPGKGWVYSVSVDIQGHLIEKLSGKSLPDFMNERIFAPLGMKDTGFAVPEDELPRLATVYSNDMKPMPRDPNVSKVPGLASGGGGLYSTAPDYLRFAQMLAGGGEVDDVRILSPSSVELMRSNHLPDELMTGGFGIGMQRMRPGRGFGYDVAVFVDPVKVGSTTGKGSYLWDGAAGTWFTVDPTNDVVFVGMIQRMMGPGMPNLQSVCRALVYQALVDPSK